MKRFLKRAFFAAILIAALAGGWGLFRPLPEGISFDGELRYVAPDSVSFFGDETYVAASGERSSDQRIFDEAIRMIGDAQQIIVADFFLYNSFMGAATGSARSLSSEMTDALIAKKKTAPYVEIIVITDPINSIYGSADTPHLRRLEGAGIRVIVTDLSKLRDSNPLYSGFWRGIFQWPDILHRIALKKEYTERYAPNPFDAGGEKVTVRSYLKLLNFKANHRKALIADAPAEGGQRTLAVLATSANPHDGSSAHSNVALRAEGQIAVDALEAERAVARFSGSGFPEISPLPSVQATGSVAVAYLTEGAIKRRALAMLDGADKGDSVDLAQFYLSDNDIIDAIVGAAQRGAAIRLLLDPNKDAFGRQKGGIPNRSVAYAILRDGGSAVTVRWCDTHGEQCHGKMLLVRGGGGFEMLLGSANYTRRNLDDFNLENDIYAASGSLFPAYADARAYFERFWFNASDQIYSADYGRYADASRLKRVIAYLQEVTGLSSF